MLLLDQFAPRIPLTFNPEGHFRILLLSDAHLRPGDDRRTPDAVEKLLAYTHPDLVMLLGDQEGGCEHEDHLRSVITRLVTPMEERNIPWAHVFGNHDETPVLSKAWQETLYESFPHCLSRPGPEDIPGVGNYFLPIRDARGRTVFGIWALDSHQDLRHPSCPLAQPGELIKDLLLPDPPWGKSDDEFICFQQVQWYFQTSLTLEKENGGRIPSLMCFHIPLPEFHALIRNPRETGMRGENRERICCSTVNSGLFAAVLQRGDVRAIFTGHDHNNTFDGLYCGIRLGYDGSIGYQAYGLSGEERDSLRGGRIVDLDLTCPESIRTEMVLVRDVETHWRPSPDGDRIS